MEDLNVARTPSEPVRVVKEMILFKEYKVVAACELVNRTKGFKSTLIKSVTLGGLKYQGYVELLWKQSIHILNRLDYYQNVLRTYEW